jgi:hypothetical protein
MQARPWERVECAKMQRKLPARVRLAVGGCVGGTCCVRRRFGQRPYYVLVTGAKVLAQTTLTFARQLPGDFYELLNLLTPKIHK